MLARGFLLLICITQTISSAHAVPTPHNATTSVPRGAWVQGDVVCVPTKWSDIFTFYLVNYVSHAATVRSLPGEMPWPSALNVAMALLFPYSGILRGLEAIIRRAEMCKDDLDKAKRSGALCVVVRDRWWHCTSTWWLFTSDKAYTETSITIPGSVVPRVGTKQVASKQPATGARASRVSSATSTPDVGNTLGERPLVKELKLSMDVYIPDELCEGRQNPLVLNRIVHGVHHLPLGFSLAYLPSNAIVIPEQASEPGPRNGSGPSQDIQITSGQNLPKAIVAVVQAVFSISTLYRSRGDQTNRYGYSSFGLTVIPYATMSLINLVGNIVTPQYPALYLINSPELAEARVLGAKIDGAIGTIKPKTEQPVKANPVIGRLESKVTSKEGREDIRDFRFLFSDSKGNTYAGSLDGAPNTTQSIRIPACTPFETDGTPAFDTRKIIVSSLFAATAFGAIPYAIIGGLTHFHAGESTLPQRAWTMSWLSVGIFMGVVLPSCRAHWERLRLGTFYVSETAALRARRPTGSLANDSSYYGAKEEVEIRESWYRPGYYFLACLYAAPAIGGFVVVGQMLKAYGSCTRV